MPEPTPVALAVVVRTGRVLVGRREGDPLFPDHWEFPGGKIRPGELPSEAVVRELGEETGLIGSNPQPFLEFEHRYPGRGLRFHCFFVTTPGENEPTVEPGRWRWVNRGALEDLAMPEANGRILEALAGGGVDE